MGLTRILLTGDDGFNSVGTRILIAALRDRYDLAIAGTKTQQSSVGGGISVRTGGAWAAAEVDGIRGFWVDGTPVDAVECARVHFRQPFDLVISGINMGLNVGGTVISSGTFSAAHRAASLGLAPVAVAMSWDVSPSMFFYDHNGADDVSAYAAYPGAVAGRIIEKAAAEAFWQSTVINVNFPKTDAYTGAVRFTRLMERDAGFWPPVVVDQAAGSYTFPPGNHITSFTDERVDAGAVVAGAVSVTLCRWDMRPASSAATGDGAELTL
jgi:5'/3'-nucleotidase SurE